MVCFCLFASSVHCSGCATLYLVATRELQTTREGLFAQTQLCESSSAIPPQRSFEVHEAFAGDSALRQRHSRAGRRSIIQFQDSSIIRPASAHGKANDVQEGLPRVVEGQFRNYSESKSGPLSITLRKLIFLMPAMQLRKLQRRLLDADKIHSDKVSDFSSWFLDPFD
jgi:hypothetical protein